MLIVVNYQNSEIYMIQDPNERDTKINISVAAVGTKDGNEILKTCKPYDGKAKFSICSTNAAIFNKNVLEKESISSNLNSWYSRKLITVSNKLLLNMYALTTEEFLQILNLKSWIPKTLKRRKL